MKLITLKNKFYKILLAQVQKNNRKVSEQIPKNKLQKKHLKNATLLLDRFELLENLPKGGVAAEIGVDEGVFSENILRINNPAKLHLIDVWGDKRFDRKKYLLVQEKLESPIREGRIEINLGLSTEVVKEFDDGYFDWIYLDTGHSYHLTIQELESWSHKIKENGVIAGHDYIVGNWDGVVRYGVIEAVYEFCNKFNWEILYVTTELHTHPSFAIRKLHDRG